MVDPINANVISGLDLNGITESLDPADPVTMARQAVFELLASDQPFVVVIPPEAESRSESEATGLNADDTLLSDYHINWADKA